MTTLRHFKSVRDVADFFYTKLLDTEWSNWIVIKNEKTVVDFSGISGGDAMAVYRSVEFALNVA